jgi:hypothetical protein
MPALLRKAAMFRSATRPQPPHQQGKTGPSPNPAPAVWIAGLAGVVVILLLFVIVVI